ncbi:regulatory protein, Fis family [Pseudomonas flavescens]|uniref:Regulatory protein, Fis family n=1 Tax=Phytopseudomonas flavescens TaxID=29435 RepID=A0A1G8ALV4_9GAMM|nr:sigma-54-dependent Fis family transcriptional regulator [Pseudomonas flavescens]SDH21746.1 regulatory protein, Fis family [Pseudomonas flavescens]
MADPQRISLDALHITEPPHYRGASDALDVQSSPTLRELTECLFFSPGDGRIWLNDQRMVLLHCAALGALRCELIDSLGLERARGLLTRAGYLSGARDARLVQQRWADAEPASIFAAGIRLHGLEGMVKVEPLHFEFDVDRGHYDGEFLWHHAHEDDEHIAAYGIGNDPACWMELGYATGYVSGLFGRLVVFREVECRAMGHQVCRVLGKTAELWGDVEEDLRYLNASADDGEHCRLDRAPCLPLAATGAPAEDGRMIGASAAFNTAFQSLQRVALTPATVLFSGESGVGKELFASNLHRMSARREGPFVALNCAAIAESLIEAELFGVERGAYTGASHSRPGRFERAQGGTLFLDEVACLSLPGQGKLLRALQEREIERVGGTSVIHVDVRVIAATNVDLRAAVRRGDFREDLYYRLNVYPIHIPPLRERRDDIPLLVDFFMRRYCERYGRTPVGLTMRGIKALLNYDFPGNIRELQNLIERGVIASNEGAAIDLNHLFRDEELPAEFYSLLQQGRLVQESASVDEVDLFARLAADPATGLSLAAVENRLLKQALHRAGGNVAGAARMLGLTRAQYAYRLKRAQA